MMREPTPAEGAASWRQRLADDYRRIEETEFIATVPDLVDAAAIRFGDRTAIDFFEDGNALSFAELSDQVNRFAHALFQIGVKRGTHVAVLVSNRIEFPIAWLSLARLGAVMVPIVTALTPREVDFMLKDADVAFLIIEDRYLKALQAPGEMNQMPDAAHLVVIGGTDGEFRGHDFVRLLKSGRADFLPPERPGAHDLLNIQYTSGTTGLPKGVMQSHRYWILAGGVTSMIFRNEIKTILSDHPFHYMDPQWMLIMGLYCGARVDFTRRMSVKQFMGWLTSRRSELVYFADPLLKSAPTALERQTAGKVFLAYNFSGEMVRQVEERFGVRTRELYGMTEVGLAIMVPYDVEDPSIIGTCGLPTPFRECRIVDDSGVEVEPGQPGQLLVRGDGITMGYYKRPEVNARVLKDGWFHTGDLFQQDVHGFYRIIGRLKDMIKRGGENVSALEVEQVLLELPQVLDAAVVPVPDSEREEEVKAYLLLREGMSPADLPPPSVLGYCASRLAKFKIPRYIEYVESFPYTASAKVAKAQLTKQKSDLRIGAYDATSGEWISRIGRQRHPRPPPA